MLNEVKRQAERTRFLEVQKQGELKEAISAANDKAAKISAGIPDVVNAAVRNATADRDSRIAELESSIVKLKEKNDLVFRRWQEQLEHGKSLAQKIARLEQINRDLEVRLDTDTILKARGLRKP